MLTPTQLATSIPQRIPKEKKDEIVKILGQVPHARFDPERKLWLFPSKEQERAKQALTELDVLLEDIPKEVQIFFSKEPVLSPELDISFLPPRTN